VRRTIVGTAGHIDHGKTRLVEALTGIDCDRWAEEKARGITIDLGFAHLREGDLQVGFIDVPGHERFLANALAGLGGIRLMLLVVAADEGVEPQTREHLEICSLLGIPAGLVALTKVDLVEPDLVGLATLELEELLAPTPFAGAAVLPVSSVTGQGIAALKAKLLELAAAHAVPPDRERPARLPVDRAFHLKGLGLVVTGTLISGAVAPGDELELLPAGGRVRVRDVQVHGEARAAAEAGERTSLRLTGAALEDLPRGVQLATPGAVAAARSLLGRFTLLPEAPAPLSGSTPVKLHHYAGEVMGRLRPLAPRSLEPGASGLVEIRLAAPVVAVRGDRYVVRRPSPAVTLGGGEVLDPAWRRPRGKALAAALESLGGREPRRALLAWVREAGEGGTGAEELARRLGERSERVAGDLDDLVREGLLLAVPAGSGRPRRWLAPAAYRRVAERAAAVLGEFFDRHRLAAGMSKAEAVERILPGRAAALAGVYLEWLAAQGALVLDGDRVSLPGRGARLTDGESRLARAVLARYEAAGLTPPSPAEVGAELGAKREILDGVVRYLVEQGKLARLPGELLIAAAAVEALRRELAAAGWERFGVPQFKDRFGLSRKWAIPLLEHLDSIGATRRIGDERLVVR
jgi:selenocysteine-specific elongation factor